MELSQAKLGPATESSAKLSKEVELIRSKLKAAQTSASRKSTLLGAAKQASAPQLSALSDTNALGIAQLQNTATEVHGHSLPSPPCKTTHPSFDDP